MPKYYVTVHTDRHPDHTQIILAPREGLAKTRAMLEYPYDLNGDLVTYTVKKVREP